MAVDALVVADLQRGAIDVTHPATLAVAGGQVGTMRDESAGKELHEARIRHLSRKFCSPMDTNMASVEVLEGAIAALVKGNQPSHDFGQAQNSGCERVVTVADRVRNRRHVPLGPPREVAWLPVDYRADAGQQIEERSVS